MEYVLYGIVTILVVFAVLFVVNFVKALKDPDVQVASKLGMSISTYRDCQETLEEQIKWHKSDGNDIKNVRLPKNMNAFKKYCTYMRYKSEVEEWNKDEDSFLPNPNEREEYRWIKEAGL